MTISLFKIISTSILVFSIMQTNAQGKNMNPLNNQPYFTLKVNGFGAMYFAEINGVSVYREFDASSQVTTFFPVNHLMSPNNNSIELFVLPNSQGDDINPNANIEIQLLVSPNNNRNNTLVISNIMFKGVNGSKGYINTSHPSGSYDPDNQMSPSQDGAVLVNEIITNPVDAYEGGLYFSRKMTVPNALPSWSFFDSDDLPVQSQLDINSHNKLRDDLFEEYNKIQKALEKKNIDEVIELFAERNNELDAAFYYEPGTMHKKLYSSLINTVNNPDLVLSDLKPEYLGVYIDTGRKLISLKRNGAQSAIGFDDKLAGGSDRYDIVYRRSNNQWIITR